MGVDAALRRDRREVESATVPVRGDAICSQAGFHLCEVRLRTRAPDFRPRTSAPVLETVYLFVIDVDVFLGRRKDETRGFDNAHCQ